MRIDKTIAAMRRDRGRQRRAQAAMIATGDAWRADPAMAPLLGELERFGAGAALAECTELAAVFAAGDAAAELADLLCRTFVAALARRPMGQLPFRTGFDGEASSLLLARAGRARLVLHAREPGRWDHDQVGFSDALRYDAVLSGVAHGRVVRRRGPGALEDRMVELRPGSRLRLDLTRTALLIDRVERRLVVLRLHRTDERPGPSREFRCSDGAQVHQAAGDLRYSRHEMMLALLGRMGRGEAVPTMAAMARERGDDSLRWQALRECLALDTAEGFRALAGIAGAAEDSLSGPAGALRAQLIEAHPQLVSLEEHERCPA